MAALEHGTLTGYKFYGCRCAACGEARRRYNARRELLILTGRWEPLVDAQPVRDHVRSLMAAGLGWKRAADLAGLSRTVVKRLLYGHQIGGQGPSKKVRRATSVALLAVRADLDTLAAGANVDSAGIRRRAQALACLGWSLGYQAGRIGWTVQNYSAALKRDRVSVRTARSVRDLYDELSMKSAPHDRAGGPARARKYASDHGWLPPLAWDDDLVDLPVGELAAELRRRVAVMDDDEVRRCHAAQRRYRDRSPLVVAAANEYRRRLRSAVREQQEVAA